MCLGTSLAIMAGKGPFLLLFYFNKVFNLILYFIHQLKGPFLSQREMISYGKLSNAIAKNFKSLW